jgi:hypothetical protein
MTLDKLFSKRHNNFFCPPNIIVCVCRYHHGLKCMSFDNQYDNPRCSSVIAFHTLCHGHATIVHPTMPRQNERFIMSGKQYVICHIVLPLQYGKWYCLTVIVILGSMLLQFPLVTPALDCTPKIVILFINWSFIKIKTILEYIMPLSVLVI